MSLLLDLAAIGFWLIVVAVIWRVLFGNDWLGRSLSPTLPPRSKPEDEPRDDS